MDSQGQQKEEQQSTRETQERATYERLREEVSKRLAELKGAVTAENVKHALDQASERVRELGGHTTEALRKAQAAVRKDFAVVTQRMGPNWNAFSEQTADLFAVWKDRGSVFLGQAAVSVGEWLQKTGERIEPSDYRTGEITYGGTFECVACGQQLVLKHSGNMPPCPHCMKTEFRRV